MHPRIDPQLTHGHDRRATYRRAHEWLSITQFGTDALGQALGIVLLASARVVRMRGDESSQDVPPLRRRCSDADRRTVEIVEPTAERVDAGAD